MARILSIENDDEIISIEKDYLEINDFDVTFCKNGKNGLEEAQRGIYDLLILELTLPDMDNFTLCRQLRKLLTIPILIVTPKDDDTDKIRALGLGADGYIKKPFSPSVLIAQIKASLAEYERIKKLTSDSESIIQAGAVTIHPDTHRVYINGLEKNLKNKEYELLLFLMKNIDIVFSKEALYEQIWGMDAMGNNATVSVHINRLREKIENNPSEPKYIQTVWGAGYRFVVPNN